MVPLYVLKLWRFAGIYGARRAIFKAAGRLRIGRAWWTGAYPRVRRDIGILGCGQFAFSTIGYVIATRLGLRLKIAHDPNSEALNTFASFYGVEVASSAMEVIDAPDVTLLYVASNHASHAEYAIAALQAGHDVYCEKPLAVTEESFERLLAARHASGGRLYAGYNRPFSTAIRELRVHCRDIQGPLTFVATVQGHLISDDHWYRRPEEGTRICGNVGHWLDLLVHIRSWNGLPNKWRIDCTWSDLDVRDDNLTIVMTSTAGDLATITLTARSEPFEGIAETIVLQWGTVAAIIDDFRRMTVHIGPRRIRRRYWPKDVGHVAAILQPFRGEARDFEEVELSTRLMLTITDMVRSGMRSRCFVFKDEAASTGEGGSCAATAD